LSCPKAEAKAPLPDGRFSAATDTFNVRNQLFVARKALNKFLSLEFSWRILNNAKG
jgi:hypothetical protein